MEVISPNATVAHAPQESHERHINKSVLKIIIWSVFIYILFLLFSSLIDSSFSILQASKALGGTAAIFIGLSFSMTWLCYYFDFVDDKIHFRKHFGLTGYFYALAYSFSLLVVDPMRYLYGFFENLTSLDFILGLSAMAMFTFMALISHRKAITILGPKRWRKAFRIGFLAWFLLAVRAYVLEKDIWADWLNDFQGFPPPRLLLSLFVLFVLSMRLSIEFSKHYRKEDKNVNLKLNTN